MNNSTLKDDFRPDGAKFYKHLNEHFEKPYLLGKQCLCAYKGLKNE